MRIFKRGLVKRLIFFKSIVLLVVVGVAALGIGVGTDSPLSVRVGDQTEPSIAVNPNNPQHLVAGAIDVPTRGCAFFASFDGGSTWSEGLLPKGGLQECTDPSVAFDSAGAAYFAGLFRNSALVCSGDQATHCSSTTDCNFVGGSCSFGVDYSSARIGVAKSSDGGLTYSNPFVFDDRTSILRIGVDKPYVTVDTSEGPRDGRIYAAYNTVDGSNPSSRNIMVAVSADGGGSFSTFRTVATGNNFGAHAGVGPGGEVYVSWRQFSPNRIMIGGSSDGGDSWSAPVVVADIGDQDPNAGVQGTFRTTRYPVTGVSQRDGTVFVAFADDPPLFSNFDSPLASGPEAATFIHGSNNRGWTVGEYHTDAIVAGFLSAPVADKSIQATNPSVDPGLDHITLARDINDVNQIVGTFFDTTASGDRGFLLDGNGFSSTPGSPPFKPIDFPGAADTIPSGINNTGKIVGSYTMPIIGSGDTTPPAGFVRDEAGQFSTIVVPGATETVARGVNDQGSIVGCYTDASNVKRGFLLSNAQFTTLDVPGATETCAHDINSSGKIVGQQVSSVNGETLGFLRQPNGLYTTLRFPNPVGATTDLTVANGINDADEIVGFYRTQMGSSFSVHGFLAYERASQNIWVARSSASRCEGGINVTRSCTTNADCAGRLCSGGSFSGEPCSRDDQCPGGFCIPDGICIQGGTRWSKPARIVDRTSGDQFDPWMCVTRSGRIHVSWLDRRADPNNILYETFYATSADGGLSFSGNQRVASMPSDPRDADLGGFIGDYIGVACDAGGAFPAWPDLRDGFHNQNIYGTKVECGFRDNGDGTISDSCTQVMWLQDANYARTSGFDSDGRMAWSDAAQWANDLVFVGYGDWRLPAALSFDLDVNCQAGATLVIGVNCIGGELGSLFSVQGVNASSAGPFTNVQGGYYWSETEFNTGRSWVFNMSSGESGSGNKFAELSGWAVRRMRSTDTTTGSNSRVEPRPDVSVTFESVAAGGSTTVETSTVNPGPATVQFLGTFYDISTTATFTGGVSICISYSEGDVPVGQNEADLRIWHLEKNDPATASDDQWVPLLPDAGFPDVTNNEICSTAPTLSFFAIGPERPLAVILSRFEGEVEGHSVVLRWQTIMETNTAGFVLYRAETSASGRGLAGDYERISGLIPAAGTELQGASYRFVDGRVKPGRTYWYRLEDINMQGGASQHGPLSVTFYPEGRLKHGRTR